MNSNQYTEQYPDPQQEYAAEDQVDAPINFDEENGEDPLKRNTKFSWKSFGGDGFIVSVVLHAALIIFALLYVVSTVQPKPEEPVEFVSGAGGGSNGENASRQQHRMRPKPRDMSPQNKITSKSKNASLTLPEMPKMNSSMGAMGGMKAGGNASSGLGSGVGGGIGAGTGPGIGNGRAFLSAFGTSFSKTPTLTGTLYDLKRSTDGKREYCTVQGNDAKRRKDELHQAIGILDKQKFNTQGLKKRYFSAKTKLNANQVYIYKDIKTKQPIQATAATNAFAGEDGKAPFSAPGWMVVYEGEITPPETGEYRFVGMGDDALIVGLNGETVFYAYWPGEGHGPAVREPAGANWEPKDHCSTDGKGSGQGGGLQNHLFKGTWKKLQKGRTYKICIAFGEGAGGLAGAILGIEKKGEKSDGKYSVFKLAEIEPELLDILFVEGKYKADGPIFMTKKKKGNRAF